MASSPRCAAPVADQVPDRVAALGREHAVARVVDHVPAPAAVEAERERSILGGPERVLHLVAVAPGLRGRRRSARARIRPGARSGAGHRRPAPASARAGARSAAPARASPGTAGRRGRSAAAPGRGSARAPRSPGRSRSRAWSAATSARTSSPGKAPSTKTTYRSRRPTPAPPCATPSMRSSSTSPRRGRSARGAVVVLGAVPPPAALDMLVSWHALGGRPRHLRGAGRAVRRRDGPRVLPAFRGPQARVRDRADLRAPRRAVRPRRWSTSCGSALPRAAAGDERRRAPLPAGAGRRRPARQRDQGGGDGARRARGGARDRGRRRAPALPPERGGQANEPDAGRRAEIERARLDVLERELNPLHRQALERAHELARELGWAELPGDVRGAEADRPGALERQTSAFLRDTAGRYRESRRAPPARTGRLRLRRAAAIRPAALLPGTGIRRPVSRGADRRRRSSRRSGARDRPARAVRTCASTSSSGRTRARARSARPCRCRTRCTS